MDNNFFCLACLNKNPQQLHNFVVQKVNEVPILNLYTKLTGIELYGLDNFICEACLCKLEISHFFYELCLQTALERKDFDDCICCASIEQLTPLSGRIWRSYVEFGFGHVENLRQTAKICGLCVTQLKNAFEFRRLCLESHETSSPVVTSICKVVEIEISDVEVQRDAVKSDPNTCQVCLDSFATLKSLHEHLEMHEQAFKMLELEDVHQVSTAMSTGGSKLKFNCQKCPEQYVTQLRLQRHEKTMHAKDRLICKLCDEKFLKAQSLWEHAFVHKGFSPYVCPKCSKEFRILACFKVHLKEHGMRYNKCHGYQHENYQQVMDFVLKKD